MCDYSLQALKFRPAKVDDKLTVTNFGMGTLGFRGVEDTSDPEAMTAVCLLPGTELAFSEDIKDRFAQKTYAHRTAIFRQRNKDQPLMHHDAIELPDGEFILLTMLAENTRATVLQLPAAPKTEQEAKEQTRLEVVG